MSQWSLVELRRTGEYGVVSPRPSCASWIGVTRSTIRAPLCTRHSLCTLVLCHGTQASRRNHGLFHNVIGTPLQLDAQASFNSNVSLSSFRARLLLTAFADPNPGCVSDASGQCPHYIRIHASARSVQHHSFVGGLPFCTPCQRRTNNIPTCSWCGCQTVTNFSPVRVWLSDARNRSLRT